MDLQALYHAALVTHIIGLSMMAGLTLADYIMFRQFWKIFHVDLEKARGIRTATSKLPVLLATGFILLVLSGVTMMAITHGVFGEQLWFRIKFALVVIIFVNAMVVGRRQGGKLNKALFQPDTSSSYGLAGIRNNIRLFHLAQMVLFITIFSLSVFKFN